MYTFSINIIFFEIIIRKKEDFSPWLLYLKTNLGLDGDVGLELFSLDFDIDLRLNDDDNAEIPRLAGSCK